MEIVRDETAKPGAETHCSVIGASKSEKSLQYRVQFLQCAHRHLVDFFSDSTIDISCFTSVSIWFWSGQKSSCFLILPKMDICHKVALVPTCMIRIRRFSQCKSKPGWSIKVASCFVSARTRRCWFSGCWRSVISSVTVRLESCFLVRNTAVCLCFYWNMEDLIYRSNGDCGVKTNMRYN